MMKTILRGAHRLDEWLRHTIGRPYHWILGAGLLIDIVSRLRDIGAVIHSPGGLLKILIGVLFLSALLVNQLAELHERAARRAERFAAKREQRRQAPHAWE